MESSIAVKNSNVPDRAAFWFIMLIPLMWGVGFPLTHNAVAIVDPGLYAFSRSFVALLVLFPFALHSLGRADRSIVLGGLILGISNGLNVMGQSYALSYLNSATTAFFVTLNIVFVPFLAFTLRIGKITRTDLVSVILGLIGAYVIFGGQLQDISLGYLWGLLAAFAIAVNICVIGKFTAGDPHINRMSLSFFQILFTTLTLAYFPLTRDLSPLLHPQVGGAVLYQGIFSTALAIFLQTKFQQRVGSARTAVIFNLDLVFAGLFGLVNKEWLTAAQILGGMLIFLASMLESMVAAMKKRWKKGAAPAAMS